MALRSRRLFGRAWWLLFALLVGVPALTLSVLGLRAGRADRLESEQQLRAQQRQIAQLADVAIQNVIAQFETALARPAASDAAAAEAGATTLVVFHQSGLITFPQDRLYFGPFGRAPRARSNLTDWPPAVSALIDGAQAAEAQHQVDAAIDAFARIGRAEPRLQGWAAVASARARLARGAAALDVLTSTKWADSDAVTPGGLPVAFIAGAASETVAAADRAAFVPLLRATVDSLRRGRWWLSADERTFYDTQLAAMLSAAGDTPPAADRRFAELAGIERAVRQYPPSRRDGPTHDVARGSSAALLIWIPAEDDAAAWLGAALNRAGAARLIRPALERLAAEQPFNVAVVDMAGQPVWTHDDRPAQWNSEPLLSLRGWRATFSPASSAGPFGRREWLWYGFVALLFVMLLAGMGMTAQVVRREIELARMQAEFVGAVTHEFKSPITSIRLLMERVAGGRVASPAAAMSYYSAIGQETDRLERLVNRLLDAQQIEAGQRRYAFTSESLDEVADDVIRHLQPIADAKNIRIEVEASAALPPVQIDRAAITDAIENLVDNAIKYSRGGTRILVRLHGNGDRVSVEVADQGIGIERDEIPRVFDKFYRARRGDLQSVRGTGLGLALVKAAAEAHGGTVDVESEPGVGSRFTLQLPSVHVRSAAL
jgi:signal transduction histidine kinase